MYVTLIPDISVHQNWHWTFLRRSGSAQVRIGASQDQCKSGSVQVRIGASQDRHWSGSAQVKIGAEKNEPTLLYSALIKKNSCAKLIVLHLMVTRYIGNMIAFLRCHYALHWEHDYIFALPICLSVNHYYKQVIIFT